MNQQSQLPDWAKQIAVFDLETTGLDLTDARIVTACVLELNENGEVIQGSAFEWLANPEIEIPKAASDVHGITTEIAVRDGRPAKDVVSEIINALQNCFSRGLAVVAYNAPYDFTILHHEAIRHGIEPLKLGNIIDPLVIDKQMDKYRKGKRRLENAAEVYQVPLTDAHNATADAIAAGRVAQAIANKFANELPSQLSELHDSQIAWSEAIDRDFAKYMQQNVNPDFTLNLGWPLKLG
ncbi:MAG: exonuclease domain-containing protein [Rhodoluna sp.]